MTDLAILPMFPCGVGVSTSLALRSLIEPNFLAIVSGSGEESRLFLTDSIEISSESLESWKTEVEIWSDCIFAKVAKVNFVVIIRTALVVELMVREGQEGYEAKIWVRIG